MRFGKIVPSTAAQPKREDMDVASTGFGQFCVAVESFLTRSQSVTLATWFGYPPAKTDSILNSETPSQLLVQLMVERGEISPTDISTLINALESETVHLNGVASNIKGAFQKYVAEALPSTYELRDQTTKKEPAENKQQKKRPSSSVKETGPPKRQKKSPATKKSTPVKGKVGGPNTGQKSNKNSNISLKIIDQEDRGYPKPNRDTGKWFRGTFTAANESNWFYITIWDEQGKEEMSLFKKGLCVILKGVTIKEHDISFGQSSKVEKSGTAINVGEDILRKMEKNEKKNYQTLEEIKKSGKDSKTKLHLCEVGECQTVNRRSDGKKIVLRDLTVRNHSKSKKNPDEVVLTLFGPDARKSLKKGQTIVLNACYNTARRKFESKGNFIMKILKKSKKGKSKKRKKNLK